MAPMIVFNWLWFLVKVTWWALGRLAAGFAWVLRVSSTDHRLQGALGTARWATWSELFWAGVYRGRGPVVGRSRFGRLMRFTRDGTVQVFGAMGSGKGIGVVIPTLLDYPGSIVVTDVKGENVAITARDRARRGDVVKFDPSDLAHSARFNPIDMIRVGSDHEQDDARMLAELMVVRDSSEGHWSTKSLSLLAALILHVVHDPDPVRRTLAQVRRLSVQDLRTFRATLEEIATRSPASLAQSAAQGFLRSIDPDDARTTPELQSIMSDLDKATEPWTEGTPTGRLSAETTFHLERITGPEVVTVYFCVDEEKLAAYGRWLRVMTGCTLAALMRAKRTGRPKHKVVLLLDEVFILGRLEPLERAAGLLRAYCTPVLIWQSVPQARAVYGEGADAFIANANCRVFLATNDQVTASHVTQLCGQTGVRTRSQGVSQSSDAWLRENRSEGQNEGGYWLIDPSEVQRLPPETAIVKMGHVSFPIRAYRANYLSRLRWWGRYDRWEPGARAPIPARHPTNYPGPPPAPPPGRAAVTNPRSDAGASVPPPAARSAPPPGSGASW